MELLLFRGEIGPREGFADVVPFVVFGRVPDPQRLRAEDVGVYPEADFRGQGGEEGEVGVVVHAVVGEGGRLVGEWRRGGVGYEGRFLVGGRGKADVLFLLLGR